MLQPMGSEDTVFLVHGTGWPPGSQVSVALAGHRVSSVRPGVDPTGTFNYAIDQGHRFFAGLIPPGVYHVIVTGPGGRRARARFQVVPLPGPGTGGPPGGSAPPGSGRSPGTGPTGSSPA
jgi:hypothetical protein